MSDLIFICRKRIKNFSYAVKGILFLIKREPNAKLYLVMTVLVPALGIQCHLHRSEWTALILAGSLVWMAEALNTAIELLGDEISLEQRERIGRAKDVAAGGVLLAAIGALIVFGMIFAPHIAAGMHS